MGWETILNIAGFLFGAGALVTLFMAGRRVGQLEEQIESLRKLPAGLTKSEVEVLLNVLFNQRPLGLAKAEIEVLINEVTSELMMAMHALENSLGEDTEERVQAVHKRVDTFNELIGATKHEAGQTAEAIRGMRREWEQLSAELRGLLRNEGVTTAEVNILKERFHLAEQRVAELVGKLSVLDTVLREMQRIQNRK